MVKTIKTKGKNIFKSKTLWVNSVLAIMAGLNQLGDLGVAPERVILGMAIGNILLRFLTKEPVNLLPSKA